MFPCDDVIMCVPLNYAVKSTFVTVANFIVPRRFCQLTSFFETQLFWNLNKDAMTASNNSHVNWGTAYANHFLQNLAWDIPRQTIEDFPLQCHGVSNHRHLDCLLTRLVRRTSKKISKLRLTFLGRRINQWPVDSSHNEPVMRKIFPFDDVIMPRQW